ncbi:MFS transporter [Agrobacterium rhizogenes]|uniref:MFS transporter n=1 Tax=Rhizobium rhizogenes TaxID=359 RepID=UPI000DDC87EC|nr:MFS transporter [Rhizobium rhizogenes]KAA6487817.1 MFS transporter [Agrobacterium sp. ICMP 7243]NTF83877.1 MFS transporter [Rhizobium rhizogenes]NTF89512.1 MFS transporter [Rhizobium rhizogenes]NTG03278.1 MFS transporter [Rhizobium rhizogenes]NTG16760.1 MFS transporter [Rhizobium rhizogenes]
MQNLTAGVQQGLLLVAVAWLAPIGSTLFAPVLPHMIAHFSDVQGAELLAPVALVTPALFVALLAPVAGILADRIGRKRLLLAALAIYAVAGIAPYWIDNLYGIILSRGVVGIAEAGVMTASTALICDYFMGERRAHWLSVQFGSASLVATVCFVLAGLLGGYNWRAPFLVYSATAFFIPIVLVLIFEPAAAAPKEHPVVREDGARRLFTPRFVGCLALTLLCGMLFYVTPVHISLILSERGFTDARMLGLASAVGSFGVVAGAAAFRIQSKRSIGALLVTAMAAQAIGYATLYTQTSLVAGVVGMFLNNIGCGISLPLVLAFTMSRLPDDYRGRASGVWTSVFFVGQFVCPFCVAAIAAASGGMVASTAVFAGITLLAALLFLAGSVFGHSFREPATSGRDIVPIH